MQLPDHFLVFVAITLGLILVFMIGIRRGRSVMGTWLSADRKTNPIGFWLGQVFIGLLIVWFAVVLILSVLSR
jgi:hypothetical protein